MQISFVTNKIYGKMKRWIFTVEGSRKQNLKWEKFLVKMIDEKIIRVLFPLKAEFLKNYLSNLQPTAEYTNFLFIYKVPKTSIINTSRSFDWCFINETTFRPSTQNLHRVKGTSTLRICTPWQWQKWVK